MKLKMSLNYAVIPEHVVYDMLLQWISCHLFKVHLSLDMSYLLNTLKQHIIMTSLSTFFFDICICMYILAVIPFIFYFASEVHLEKISETTNQISLALTS